MPIVSFFFDETPLKTDALENKLEKRADDPGYHSLNDSLGSLARMLELCCFAARGSDASSEAPAGEDTIYTGITISASSLFSSPINFPSTARCSWCTPAKQQPAM